MKTWMRACLLTAATASALTVCASAAHFTNRADDLYDMGLFAGSELGYELDRAPERAEAAVMLVRLLGAEAEAKAANLACPFTDVPDWAAPYIGWLYQEGLTSGATATTFEPYGACSSQMYATFLLRALGYSDANGDFTYADALDFATQKQVVDLVNYNPDAFLRDNMVAMSYTALAQHPKNSTDTLLATLVEAGAIDADKAADTLSFFDLFAQTEAILLTAQQPTTMHTVGTMQMHMGEMGSITAITDSTVSSLPQADNMNASQIFMQATTQQTLTAPSLPEPQTTIQQMAAYYADGMYYISSPDVNVKMPMDFNAVMGANATQTTPICFYDAITVLDSNTYTLVFDIGAYDAAMQSLLGNLIDLPESTSDAQTVVHTMETTITKHANGNLHTTVTYAEMAVVTPYATMEITTENSSEILVLGDGVTITAPTNLDSYVSMEEYSATQAQ